MKRYIEYKELLPAVLGAKHHLTITTDYNNFDEVYTPSHLLDRLSGEDNVKVEKVGSYTYRVQRVG